MILHHTGIYSEISRPFFKHLMWEAFRKGQNNRSWPKEKEKWTNLKAALNIALSNEAIIPRHNMIKL